MSQISAAIGRLYARVTDPWLSTTIVCAGIWLAYKGLIRREVAAGVGALAAVAMLVLGLWVVHQPGASVGQLATLSDRVALGVVGAPQAGSAARPSDSYAEAMSRLWSRLVEVPFAGLDFSDVGALALLAALSSVGDDEAKRACAQFAHRRYGEPKRVIDLYLRSSPGSPARQALWDFFDKDEDERYKAKVAAQGGDGVLTRLSMLALFAIGLLGAVDGPGGSATGFLLACAFSWSVFLKRAQLVGWLSIGEPRPRQGGASSGRSLAWRRRERCRGARPAPCAASAAAPPSGRASARRPALP